jgi:hypothetical protein
MNNKEKATIILESLDKFVQIDWNFEDVYMKAIIKGLDEISSWEKREKGQSE